MTQTRPVQTAFSSGELDPLLHAREDFQRHQTGMALCRGFVPLRQGGFTRAPGTIFRGFTRDDLPAVRLPFVFAQNDAVELEFTPGKMRVWRYGALVMDGDDPYQIDTPFLADDLPGLNGAQDADVMYLLDGRNPMQQLSRFALDNWTLAPADLTAGPFRVQNLDEAKTIQVVPDPDLDSFAPWLSGETLAVNAQRKAGLRIYRYVGTGETVAEAEGGEVGTLPPTHATGTQGYEVEEGPPVLSAFWEFIYEIDPTDELVTLQGTGDLFVADHVGALLLLEPVDWLQIPIWVGNAEVAPGSLIRFDGNVYQIGRADGAESDFSGTTNVPTGVNPPVHPSGTVRTDASRETIYRHVSTERGVVRILTVTDANTATAEVVTPVPAPLYDNATYRWSLGAWNTLFGHPAYLTLHEQRMFVAGAPQEPRTITASEQAAYRSFLPSAEATGSFAYDIGGGGSRNAITWLADGRKGIWIGSLGEVRRGHSGGTDPIGPLTFRPEIASRDGCAPIQPVLPFGWPIYVTSDQSRLLEVRYDFSQDELRPIELSLPSQHIGNAGFEQIIWQATPEHTGWLRLGDGSVALFVYDPENDVQGWAVLPLAGGFVEHLSVSPAANGASDIVTLLVRRTLKGVVRRCVEEVAVNTRALRGADPIHTANHGFCGAVLSFDAPTDTISVPHLAEETVSAWTDEGGFSDLPVAPNGTVILPLPVTRAVIGLRDPAHRARTLPLRAAARDGDTRGRLRRLTGNLGVQIHRTSGGNVRVVERNDAEVEYVGPPRELLDPAALANPAVASSGTVRLDAQGAWATEVSLEFEPVGLAPMTITAVIPAIDDAGP